MSLEFKRYSILNVEDLIDITFNDTNSREKYKVKKLKRKNNKIKIFSVKAFKKYSDEYEVQVVGRIRKHQCHYRDIDTDEQLIKEKKDKKIIGQANLVLPKNNSEEKKYKKYDVKKDTNKHTYGYAWVGDNKFLRVTSFNILWLLILCLIIIGILLGLNSCPRTDNPFEYADGNHNDVIDNTTQEQAPLCYYVPFAKTTTITKENQTISLYNVKENDGNYYISYEIYIDGNYQKLTVSDNVYHIEHKDDNAKENTGAIIPGEKVLINLYDGLDAGTYKLTCKGKEYDYNTKEEMSVTYNLTTTLVVDK